jgi:hypothetical protein
MVFSNAVCNAEIICNTDKDLKGEMGNDDQSKPVSSNHSLRANVTQIHFEYISPIDRNVSDFFGTAL